MDNYDFSRLNLPPDMVALMNADPNAQVNEGTFQLEDAAEAEDEDYAHTTPQDQVVSAVKAYEQLAFIAAYFFKATSGVPPPSVMPGDCDEDYSGAIFHLQTE